MPSKIFYFDVETTGLDPVQNAIIQLAGIIVIDGKAMEEFEFKIAPFETDHVSQEALDVHGYSVEDIKGFTTPSIVYQHLLNIFSKYVNKFDKSDKMTPAGYNVRFDMDFLKNFFLKNGDVYFGSWLNWKMIDPLPLLHFIDFAGGISLPDYKLASVCAHFGIELQAHDALSDIRATRQLIGLLFRTYFKKDTSKDHFVQLGEMVCHGELIINEFLTPAPLYRQALELIGKDSNV